MTPSRAPASVAQRADRRGVVLPNRPRLVAAPVVRVTGGPPVWGQLHLPSERSSTVPALNEYAVERAVLLLESDRGPGPGMIVQVTPGVVRSRRRTADLLRRCDGVPAVRGRLMVGVPESVAFEDLRAVLRLTDGLAERGALSLLRGAWTGWLAMASLREAPWSIVALTHRMTDQWDGSPQARAITRSLAEQAREAGIQPLASGVDTPARRRLAGRLGVELVAGRAAGPDLPVPRERS